MQKVSNQGRVRFLVTVLSSVFLLNGCMLSFAQRTDDGATETRAAFDTLAGLMDQLNDKGLALDTLSMGMSGDMEQAIAAGSTMVRIGTDIFGARSLAG